MTNCPSNSDNNDNDNKIETQSSNMENLPFPNYPIVISESDESDIGKIQSEMSFGEHIFNIFKGISS